MQQFFCDEKIEVGDFYPLNKEIIYQLLKVLRANNGYLFRLVDKSGIVYLCELRDNKAFIKEKLLEDNETSVDITVIMSLIKNDKFDLCVQKLTELGVKRIVPYIAKRSVVKEGKGNNKLDRLRKIAKEASEQSHRNFIPEICNFISFKDLAKYKSDVNILDYEKEEKKLCDLKDLKSISILIGPEGGFEKEEVFKIVDLGFSSVSLGKRILRAETAAIYLTSLIVGNNI